METPSELVSPKQVSRAIGVSESSLKRWCDQGLIKTIRTAGGHRKMLMADVLRFVRENDHPLISPEVLGLPPVSQNAELGLTRSLPRLVDALLAGDELLARQIVFDLYLAQHSISVICDEVITAAFREIGDRWACHEAAVYQERRGCEICLRVLFDLRKIQRLPDMTQSATGGTIEGDHYTLPTAMAELVLRDTGFRATSLGTSIPFDSLIKVVQETKPKLFWLSVSYVREGLDFVGEFAKLSNACLTTGTALTVGGRALTDELRHRMNYSAYCDTMQHLERFARTLIGAKPVEPTSQAAAKPRRGASKK
ncbi:MAG: B12-binding domain-containing protein [Planctomycetes bacterium]|nr:B12-binding domain-containing protein [Planctomycetota bacterium]